MEKGRKVNFSAGPSCLPYDVLLEAQNDLLCYKDSGQSVMEMSHRSKEFKEIFEKTKNDIRQVLEIPTEYDILFMQGGATLQFSCVPLNCLKIPQSTPFYAITGTWSEKAYKECQIFTSPEICIDTKESNYTTIPALSEWKVSRNASYVHYTSNETIHGVEFQYVPHFEDTPIVCDMSSNFLSRPIDVNKHSVIYAGAQKNAGPAGCTIVIVNKNVLGKELNGCPSMCSYSVMSKNDSMYNTPPCWNIYMIGLMVKFVKQRGGIHIFEDITKNKSNMLYSYIDASDNYYVCPVCTSSRSRMNVPFRVCGKNQAMESKFVKEAETCGLINLAGHRSVGGCRASLYTGMTEQGILKLIEFMQTFKEENLISG